MALTHDRKKHKRDVILIAAVLAAAVFLSAAMGIFNGGPGGTAVVTVDGREIAVLDLSKDQELTADGAYGGSNHIKIQDGQVWVTEATCPDKICIHQGKISQEGETIVCLPNRMIIQIFGE